MYWEIAGTIAATGTELGVALAALSAAVVAWRRRFVKWADAWTLIGTFTGGLFMRCRRLINMPSYGDHSTHYTP